MNIKLQVIVRKDLNLSEGAMTAQVAHLAMEWIRQRIISDSNSKRKEGFTKEEMSWLANPYIYILYVDNIEELTAITIKAMENKIQYHEWNDVIWSENIRENHRVKIGLVIGPDDSDKLKLVTGNLKLY